MGCCASTEKKDPKFTDVNSKQEDKTELDNKKRNSYVQDPTVDKNIINANSTPDTGKSGKYYRRTSVAQH